MNKSDWGKKLHVYLCRLKEKLKKLNWYKIIVIVLTVIQILISIFKK